MCPRSPVALLDRLLAGRRERLGGTISQISPNHGRDPLSLTGRKGL
jgi:hypothetical protein